VLQRLFVGNGQFLPPFPSATRQHPAAIGGSHTLAKSVLVFSFLPGRLIRALHDLPVLIKGCKNADDFCDFQSLAVKTLNLTQFPCVPVKKN